MTRPSTGRISRFIVAGGLGFLIDALVLWLLTTTTTLSPFVARLISIGVALTFTWFLNRSVTFGPSNRPLAVEGARYGSVGIGTSLVNYALYAGLIATFPMMPVLVALALASVAAMALSFVGYSRLVFDRRTP